MLCSFHHISDLLECYFTEAGYYNLVSCVPHVCTSISKLLQAILLDFTDLVQEHFSYCPKFLGIPRVILQGLGVLHLRNYGRVVSEVEVMIPLHAWEFFEVLIQKLAQAYVGTRTEPSWSPQSCETFTPVTVELSIA